MSYTLTSLLAFLASAVMIVGAVLLGIVADTLPAGWHNTTAVLAITAIALLLGGFCTAVATALGMIR